MIDDMRIERIEENLRSLDKRIDRIDHSLIHEPILSDRDRESTPTPGRRRTKPSGMSVAGFALVAVGVLLLGRSLGWYYFSIPLTPTIFILLGLVLIFRSRQS